MEKYLPRLLLVSEVSLSQKGTGINRTLFNLFENYPTDRFMLYTTDESLKHEKTDSVFAKNVAIYPRRLIPYLNNRLGRGLNPILTSFDLQLINWLPLPHYKQIANFLPEVIIICPVSPMGLVIGYKVIQSIKCPFLIYFMDDWIALDNSQWLTGNLQAISNYLLRKSSGWLMISSPLEKELIRRYNIKPQQSLIVHNPVDLSNKIFPDLTTQSTDKFRVVYAGAIWPMHYDAVAVVAEAIYELRCDGIDIELVLHTPRNFWNVYQKYWLKWEVTYGDIIPYKELNQYLQKANLLLVPSSFLPENYNYSSSSLQTKLTDYMASGRAIFACGPSYSACNQFIKTWNCGLVCETNKVAEVKEILLKQIYNYSELSLIAQKAFEVVRNHFEASKVQSNLYDFIQQTL